MNGVFRCRGNVALSWTAAATCLLSLAVACSPGWAQQRPPPPPRQAQWSSLPRMKLERQFAGPLQDTIIQRWRDPADGTICYIYLPITAQHSPPTESGYVQYGANTIGSLSCLAAPPAKTAPAKPPPARRPAPQPAPPSTPSGPPPEPSPRR